MPTSTDLLQTYSRIAGALGFGRHSAATLIAAGASWPTLHALVDAGLIRCESVYGSTIIYRLLFP